MLDRPVWAEIDLGAIAQNIANFRKLIGTAPRLCAVVKADGYGHGAPQVARAALDAGADWLAVALVAEAAELRRAGFLGPILVLGCPSPDQAREAALLDLRMTVVSPEHARAFSEAGEALGRRVKVHLKVDSGMGRIGTRFDEAPGAAAAVAAMRGLELEGAYTHFAGADSEDLSYAKVQLERFMDALEGIDAKGLRLAVRHASNSAATMCMPEARLDMVRPGIAVYGLAPSAETKLAFPLAPAMRLRARVAAAKELAAGEPVSYGMTWRAPSTRVIATLPLGYADGYPRLLSSRGWVGIRGAKAPIAGRVCMDMCMADATGTGAAPGDEVDVYGGSGPSLDEVAALVGTINYEVACAVGKRVPRRYVGASR